MTHPWHTKAAERIQEFVRTINRAEGLSAMIPGTISLEQILAEEQSKAEQIERAADEEVDSVVKNFPPEKKGSDVQCPDPEHQCNAPKSDNQKLQKENERLREELREAKEGEQFSDGLLCKLWDALDARGKLQEQESAMERIRDLIAKEGELGDLTTLAGQLAGALRGIRILCDYRIKQDNLHLAVLCSKEATKALTAYTQFKQSNQLPKNENK